MRTRVTDRPIVAALAGAMAIAFSAIIYRLSETSPETASFFRCFWALPVLWFLARRETAEFGPRPLAERWPAFLAGAFFTADLLLWHYAIDAVGAGLATVVGNTQVVLVGLIAWIVFRERPAMTSLVAIPIAAAGIVLISGVLEAGAYGENPPLGALLGALTGLAYSGFLLALRYGSRDLRRVAAPLYDATIASAALTLPFGLALGGIDFTPGLEPMLWLITLALTSQVLGWLLITVSLPRLPAVLTSVLLTTQPVAAVLLGAAILAERPSPLQLLGTVAILAGLVVASAGRQRARARAEPLEAPAA